MYADPWFYLVSIPAVLLYGIAKGGFGGSRAILGAGVGYVTADVMTDDYMCILIATLALLFGLQQLSGFRAGAAREHNRAAGGVLGAKLLWEGAAGLNTAGWATR